MQIDNLERRPVIISKITQKREDELRETIRKFEELLNKGFSKTKAARKLGYYDHTVIWKKYEELKRIETERKSQQTFKDSLKVNKGDAQPQKTITESEKESIKIEILDTEAEK